MRCSTRSCLDMMPLTPMAAQSRFSSDTDWASNSSIFRTTTPRSFASCSLLSARSLASLPRIASIMSALLPASRPLLAPSSLSSMAGMVLSSFFLLASSSSSLCRSFSSTLASSSTTGASSPWPFSSHSASAALTAAAGLFMVFRACSSSSSCFFWAFRCFEAEAKSLAELPIDGFRLGAMARTSCRKARGVNASARFAAKLGGAALN
mmetsp:Transcript_36970/g.101768  ORF Transcript_36970/g.101768 Transcript_36970/m.101768 type:complete len:208 (+) Transcript_36970:1158-1781(+)